MTNRERIERGLESLPVEIHTFSCNGCKNLIGSYKNLGDKCPDCGGELNLVELKIETREVIFANCPKCNRIVSKNVVECPSCGADTVPVLSQEGQGLSGIFSN